MCTSGWRGLLSVERDEATLGALEGRFSRRITHTADDIAHIKTPRDKFPFAGEA